MSLAIRATRMAAFRSTVSLSRAFTGSSCQAMKETDGDSPDLGEAREKHKQDQLQKQNEGKGHWKPELASNSEEAVAADRHDNADHSEEGMKDLQKKTVEHVDKKHK